MGNAVFWDRIARKYAATPVRNEEAYALTLDRVRTFLSPTDEVLELGCGTGSTALKLAPSVASYLATDLSAEMIAIANEKLEADAVAGLSFAPADCGDAATLAGPFDAVLAFSLLHLVDDLSSTLARINSLVRPGGLFMSKTPCLGEKKGYLRPLISLMRLFGKAPSHVAFFRIAGLESAISDAGFDIIETGDYPADLPHHFVVARKR